MRTGRSASMTSTGRRGATQHGQIRRLVRLADEVDHDGARLTQEAHVLHVALAELETADAEPVVLGGPVLLDVAARLEGARRRKTLFLWSFSRFDSSVTPSSSDSPKNCSSTSSAWETDWMM
jgi:hypothetical protein